MLKKHSENFAKTEVICPKCGKIMAPYEDCIGSSYYACSCGFQAAGSFFGQYKATPEEMIAMLRGKEIGPFAFTSPRGKPFKATLGMDISGHYGRIHFADYNKSRHCDGTE